MAGALLKTRRDPPVVVRGLADKLSLSMFDVGRLLAASIEVPTAAWGFDRREQRERIWLNWELLATLPDDELLWLIRRETLHRAGYAEGYEFGDAELGSLTLEIVVNKVLHLADPELSVRVTRRIYPEMDKLENPAQALARCDLTRQQLPERLGPIWDEVWGDERVPSVYPIYFALLLFRPKQPAGGDGEEQEGQAGQQPRRGRGAAGQMPGQPGPDDSSAGGEPGDEQEQGSEQDEKQGQGQEQQSNPDPGAAQLSLFEEDGDGQLHPRTELTKLPPQAKQPSRAGPPPTIRSLPEEAPRDAGDVFGRAGTEARAAQFDAIKRGISGESFSRTFSRFFSKLQITKQRTHTEEIEEFLSQIRGQREVDDAISRLMAAVGVDPRVEVVPGQLTTTGIFLAAAGISARTGLWWNEVPFERRPRLRIYVDTSPSMAGWATRTVYVVDTLRDELPTKMYAFAGSVVEVETADFAKGDYYRGYSTCFDAVIEDLYMSDDELGLIITDGQSSVQPRNKERARTSGKQIFTILCGSHGRDRYDGLDLREISQETMSLFEKPRNGRV